MRALRAVDFLWARCQYFVDSVVQKINFLLDTKIRAGCGTHLPLLYIHSGAGTKKDDLRNGYCLDLWEI